MKVLMLSIDNKIFEEGSSVYKNIQMYGKLVDELHIIVYTKPGFERKKVSDNVFAYPTNTKIRSLYFLHAYRICKEILNRKGLFLVTSQEAMTNLLAVVLKFRFSLHLQVQVHTDFADPHFREESIKNKLRFIGYFIGVKYADCIRVVSKRIKSSIPKTNISVLPIFVDTQSIRDRKSSLNLHKKYKEFDFIVLMVGRLTEEKNISLALAVLKNIVKKYPKTGLVIVGDGPNRGELESLVVSYKLQNNVVFVGAQNDVIPYYKDADLFLHTANYEGYGLVLIEAAAAGCPIVTTDVGVVGEVLNKTNALICPVGDKECLVRQTRIALENKNARKNLGYHAQHVADSMHVLSKDTYMWKHQKMWNDCIRNVKK